MQTLSCVKWEIGNFFHAMNLIFYITEKMEEISNQHVLDWGKCCNIFEIFNLKLLRFLLLNFYGIILIFLIEPLF